MALHLPSKEDEFWLSKEAVTIHTLLHIEMYQQLEVISVWYTRRSFGVGQI